MLTIKNWWGHFELRAHSHVAGLVHKTALCSDLR